jgi:hypothetical protein
MKKCLFDQWYDKEQTNLGSFTTLIFQAFIAAGGNNRVIMANAWPEWFKDSKLILQG